MSSLIDDLFRHHQWANLRLLDDCRELTDEQLDSRAVGAYGTIRQTLAHLVSAEQSYVVRLGGMVDEPRIREGDAFPGFDAMHQSLAATAPALAERAHALAGMTIQGSGPDIEIDVEVVLVQAINHATEHRSQICTILTALGVQPPELDGWTWGEATERERQR